MTRCTKSNESVTIGDNLQQTIPYKQTNAHTHANRFVVERKAAVIAVNLFINSVFHTKFRMSTDEFFFQVSSAKKDFHPKNNIARFCVII